MQMHDASIGWTLFIHSEMEEQFFRGQVSRKQLPVTPYLRYPGGIEAAQRRVRWRDKPVIVHADAEVAAATCSQSSVEKGLASPYHAFPYLRFIHRNKLQALRKRSSLPKFPDFRARAKHRLSSDTAQ